MRNTGPSARNGGENPLRDYGSESYWANFRNEVGIAPSYGFPPDLEVAAEDGNPRAQNNLAVLYYIGRNRDKDYKTAAFWFGKAADQGFAVAQYNLGFMYQQGHGVEKDDARAFDLFLNAAVQGYAIAQFRLSQYYAFGRGSKFSIADQHKWLDLAAKSGNPLAQFNLGKFSTEEILLKEIFGDSGRSKDQAGEKLGWLVKSAEDGYAPALVKLGNYYQYGYGIKQDLRKAAGLYYRAAEQGYRRGQYYLSKCLYFGTGVERDAAEAIQWLYRAALGGDSDAQFDLGLHYHHEVDDGNGKNNLGEAVKWYLQSAEQGNVEALYQLFTLAKLNARVIDDLKEALPVFRKAAEKGNSYAQYQLGLIYEHDLDSNHEFNSREAALWIRKSAEQGNTEALYHLGQPYETGTGDREIMRWYHGAADNGHETACFNLGRAYLHGTCGNIRVAPDHRMAFRYLVKAAIGKKLPIVGELALCYLCGFGVEKNITFALDIFKSLAFKQEEFQPISTVAKMALAKMYLAGEWVKRSAQDALYYLSAINDFRPYIESPEQYRLSGCLKVSDDILFQWVGQQAAEGDATAQAVLGLYHWGRGNNAAAEKWYRLAAAQGNLQAQEQLAKITNAG